MKEDKELEKIRCMKMERIMEKKNRKIDQTEGKIIEITDFNFSNVIEISGLVVVDCWAAWCGPCRMLAPIIDELAIEYSDKIVFGKLNVDKNKKIPLQYQIMSIPTILVFKNGKLVDKILGVIPKQALESRIIQYL